MAEKFYCSLVTPEASMFEKDVTYVTIPAHDGEIGLAPNRAPLLVELGEGELSLIDGAGKRESYQLSGGFAQMLDNKLTILTNTAEVGEGN